MRQAFYRDKDCLEAISSTRPTKRAFLPSFGRDFGDCLERHESKVGEELGFSRIALFICTTFVALFIAIIAQAAAAQSPAPTVNSSSAITPSPAATLSPRALFDRTFARLETYPIPPYVVYTTLWHMHAYSRTEPPEYDALWRYAIRESDSLENAASPQTEEWLPQAWIGNGKGYLSLFGTILRPPTPIASASPDTTSGLKVIAVVAATEDYRIDLVGTEKIDCYLTDHLRLTPLRDSVKYNLRDLWVDTQSFDLRKARLIIEHHPDHPNWNGAAMTVDFGPALQYWIVMHSNWFAGGPYGSHIFDVTTLRVAFPPALPDWLYDQSAYDQRQKAGEPDLLDKILKASKPPT